MQKKTEIYDGSQKLSDSHLLWAVVSLLVAVVIWVYYGLNFSTAQTMTFYGVEVTYTGEAAMRDSLNLIISDEDTTTVNVTLTGSRRDLSKLTSADLKAVVNLSSVTTAGYRTMGYTLSYPSSVNSAGITIKSQTPSTIGLQISKLATKPVEVRGQFDGTVQDGYAVDSTGMTFDPGYVTLIGPEEELEQVSYASVVVDRDNVSSTFTVTANFSLVGLDGEVLTFEDVTMDADTINVTVPINLTKEVALGVTLVEGGGATADNVTATITPSTITLAGDAATLDSINTIYIATIDLSDYVTFPSTEYSIVLPNDTENLSGVTTATVDLSFNGLAVQPFVATNISYINLAEGYTAEIYEPTLLVTIRAPESVLDVIEANNIRVVADLTDITNSSKVPVTVYVDGYSEAGAVGDYAVYVQVKPEE
jgi:YbbR domain-containing protein